MATSEGNPVSFDFTRHIKPNFIFGIGLALLALGFYWLYLNHLFIVQNVNMEATDLPFTVGHMEIAKSQNIPPVKYFESGQLWKNLKQEDPHGAFSYGNHQFQYEYYIYQSPLLNILYLPFVKLWGVSSRTIAAYSTFFSFLTFILTFVLAWKIFDRWHALFAVAFMLSSITWLIHTKVGYAAWMPSTLLMNILALTLYSYHQKRKHWMLWAMGISLALMYFIGWITIVFAGLLVLLSLINIHLPRIPPLLKDFCIIGVASLVTLIIFTFAYSLYYSCDAKEIHVTILNGMFGRFSQGEPGMLGLSIFNKISYTLKCMFLDMQTTDPHADKYLEGSPAVPFVFSLYLILGIFYAVKEKTVGDKFLLAWILSILGFLCLAFVFSHRYVLLCLPAMSIVAARGLFGLGQNLPWRHSSFLSIVLYYSLGCIAIFGSLINTYHNYYVTYTLHKSPHLEADRIRGHFEFSEWLKQTNPPSSTLVVLGDPVMFPHSLFLFNTYNWNYDFIYWSNHFKPGTTKQQVTSWEKTVLGKYSKIVFAFSPQLIGDPKSGLAMNDCRPFLEAHPDIKISFIYRYGDRPPSILAAEISRDSLIKTPVK